MPHDGTAAKMRFDVDVVRRHQVDDVLVRLAFAAGISHACIIVKSADDVNNYELVMEWGNTLTTLLTDGLWRFAAPLAELQVSVSFERLKVFRLRPRAGRYTLFFLRRDRER